MFGPQYGPAVLTLALGQARGREERKPRPVLGAVPFSGCTRLAPDNGDCTRWGELHPVRADAARSEIAGIREPGNSTMSGIGTSLTVERHQPLAPIPWRHVAPGCKPRLASGRVPAGGSFPECAGQGQAQAAERAWLGGYLRSSATAHVRTAVARCIRTVASSRRSNESRRSVAGSRLPYAKLA